MAHKNSWFTYSQLSFSIVFCMFTRSGMGWSPNPPEAKHLFQVGLKVQHRLNAQDPGAGSCLFWLRKTTGDFAARILRFNASQLLFLGASIIDVYCYTI